MRKQALVIVLLLLAIAALIAGWALRRGANGPATEIHLSGNIEVTQVQLSFRMPGWVKERLVEEGQTVAAGDVVARLDATELELVVAQRKAAADSAAAALAALESGSRREEIAAAHAAMEQARHQLAELEAGSRPQEIRAAEAASASALATRTHAEQDFARMRRMLADNAIAQAQYDASETALNVAKARAEEAQERAKLVSEGPRREQIEQARAALEAARQRYELTRQGPRPEEIDQARARLLEAQAAVKIAQTQLAYTTLLAPVPGVVLSENVEAGEFVAAGTPIVTVGNLRDVWLRGYIASAELAKVRLGQAAEIRTDAHAEKVYAGRITFIASEAEFTPKTVQTSAERTRLVYRVKIDIDNADMDLKPGMPADALIRIER